MSGFRRSDLVEGLLEVGDDVVDVLKAGGHAHESLGYARGDEFLGAVGRVGHAGGVLEQRLCVAEGNGGGAELAGVEQLGARGAAALYLKGEHSAEAVAHLLLRHLMARERLEAGVVHALDLRVLFQPLGDSLSVGVVALHADLKGLQAAEDEIGLERAHDCAGHVLQAEHPDLADEVLLADYDAADDVAVAVEVLGDGVDDHVAAELQRELVVRRGEGVVAHDGDGVVLGVCYLAYAGDVLDLQRRVRGRFDIDGAGVRPHSGADLIEIGGVDESDVDAVTGQPVLKVGEGAAIEDGVRYDMVAGLAQRPHCGGDGADAGCGSHGVLPVLKGGYLALERGGGRVAEAGIDIPLLLPGEAAPALLAGVENERRGLINWRCEHAVRVLFVTGVYRLGGETGAVDVFHANLPPARYLPVCVYILSPKIQFVNSHFA